MKAIAETVAEWGRALRVEDIPEPVARAMRLALMDSGGLMVAGRGMDYIAAARAAAEGAGRCTAIGHQGGFTAADAALISGMAAHGEDFDDTFEGTPVHVGAVVVPAILAAVESRGLSGAEALRGLAAGGELACRLAVTAPTAMHRAGFHPTSVIGAMAATFGVSVAIGLDARRTASALGIAGSMASGIIEYLAEGASTKRLHPGWAAQSGLKAAALAEHDFLGPRTVFEGEHGFFFAFAAPEIERDYTRLTHGLGADWLLRGLAFKPYACGTMAQPFIDAAIRLRDRIGSVDRIAEIVAPTSEGIVHRLWEPVAEKAAPSTPYSAKFSVPFAIAVGLVDGAAGLAQFTQEKIQDPILRATAAKVRYRIDPLDPYPREYVGALELRMTDGSVLTASQPHLRGGKREPLSETEMTAKFRANAAFGGWTDALAQAYLEFCAGAFHGPSLAGLARFRA